MRRFALYAPDADAWRSAAPQGRNKTLGIATFDCHEDPFEPGTFHFWERYDTAAAMATFNSSPAQQAFHEKVAPLLKDGIGMVLYEWSDGKLGASAMPIGKRTLSGLAFC
jgi:quinol monooxygenase YgiN